jgi:hypothetical protein
MIKNRKVFKAASKKLVKCENEIDDVRESLQHIDPERRKTKVIMFLHESITNLVEARNILTGIIDQE